MSKVQTAIHVSEFGNKMGRKIKFFSLLLISLGLVVFLSLKLDFKELLKILKEASIPWILLGVLLFAVQILIGMLRFKHLLGIKPDLQWKIYGLQATYSVLKYWLPGFFGEVSILYLFKKSLKIDYSKSSHALFVVRVFDTMLLFLIFTLAFLFFFRDFLFYSGYLKYIMKSLFVLMLICLAVIFFMIAGRKFIFKFLNFRFFRENHWGKKINLFVIGFLSHFKASLSLRSILRLSGLSLLMWFSNYLIFVVSVRAIGINLRYTEIFFVYLILWPIQLLPVRGPGNLGTHELGWVIALSLLGYSRGSASLIAFGTHAVFIIIILVIFVFITIVYGKRTFLMMINSFKNKVES